MKLYSTFISLTLTAVSSSFAQPDVALTNKLQRPVHYGIGSSIEDILNKKLETLDPRVGAVAKTLPYDIGQTETYVLLSSKPGEMAFFSFTPEKPMYVDIKEDKDHNVLLTPQSGTFFSFWRKTERGYPLSNNVTKKDIAKFPLNSSAIPATNPDAFLKIFSNADPCSIFNISSKPKPIESEKLLGYKNHVSGELMKKWNQNIDVSLSPYKKEEELKYKEDLNKVRQLIQLNIHLLREARC